MLVTRGRGRSEDGGILVLSALLFPVFLLLVALVIDVGNWYTHKRQLQIRADAGALAAGVSYAQNWTACVQSDDPTLKATTALTIANMARQYAADPEASDYAPDSVPVSLHNSEIANQAKLDVVVNSPSYYRRHGLHRWAAGQVADPCYLHPTGDEISPAGGHWVDVKVTERDLPSLFGSIGLPLSRNSARARVEIRPAVSLNNFLPIAVPDTAIVKAQLRYYDECSDPGHALPPIAIVDLAPLPAADQTAYQNAGGGALWGPQSVTDPAVGDRSRPVSLALPSAASCGQAYLPVGVQVRIAAVPRSTSTRVALRSPRRSSRTASRVSPRSASGTAATRK